MFATGERTNGWGQSVGEVQPATLWAGVSETEDVLEELD